MTKSERKLFAERVEKIFNMMSFMPPPPEEWMSNIQVVDSIKQLYSGSITHKLKFLKNEKYSRMEIQHEVRETRNGVGRITLYERYKFHPNRKNKFELTTINSGLIYVKLFEGWSRIDVEDLLRKLKLKMVEMI